LAQESASEIGFNPQAWLRNALEWIDSLGTVGAIALFLNHTSIQQRLIFI
jgi:hypothetical protein